MLPAELERIVEHARELLSGRSVASAWTYAGWEIGLTWRLDDPGSVPDVRGGLRLVSTAAGRESATVVHGAMPGALRRAAGHPWPVRRETDWARAVAALRSPAESLRQAWRHRAPRLCLRRTGAGPGTPERVASIVSLRIRVWSLGSGGPARGAVEGCLQVRAAREARGWPIRAGAIVDLRRSSDPVGEGAGRALQALDRRMEKLRRIVGAPRAPRDTGGGFEHFGPVVLFEDLAAAWVHEMGHAAIESVAPARRAVGPPARISDDARDAPWPVGSPWDDSGLPTGRCVLWGDGAAEHAGRPAHRAEFGLLPRPALSATRLEALDSLPRAGADDLAQGTLLLAGPGPTRYEPARRRILLGARVVVRRSATGWEPIPGAAIVELDPVSAWQGVEMMIGQQEHETDQALCSRLGSMHAVMVGAPTILLDPVRVRLAKVPEAVA